MALSIVPQEPELSTWKGRIHLRSSAFICVYLRPIWFLIRGGLGSHDRSVIEGNFVSDLDAFQHRDIHGVA